MTGASVRLQTPCSRCIRKLQGIGKPDPLQFLHVHAPIGDILKFGILFGILFSLFIPQV